MAETAHSILKQLRWPLRLTRAGMLAERLAQCFWPLWSVVIAALAALMLGLQDILPIELVWALAVVAVLATLGFALRGAMAFRWPSRADALARLDATLPGRPITALLDEQAIGRGDMASVAVWRAHQARMAARAKTAHAVPPNLNVAPRDPYGLRFVALQLLLVAVMFGSIWRVGSVSDMAPSGAALAAGPTWEGWVEPPAYTGKPSLYLSDIKDVMQVPQGSTITLQLYGEVGALTVAETVSGRTEAPGSAADPAQTFDVTQSGQ